MSSFEFDISEKDMVAIGYMAQAHKALVKAAIEAKKRDGLTQREIARLLDVDKSMISRILSGRGNPTLRTIGELAWALGVKPELVLENVRAHPRANTAAQGADINVAAMDHLRPKTMSVPSNCSGFGAGNQFVVAH